MLDNGAELAPLGGEPPPQAAPTIDDLFPALADAAASPPVKEPPVAMPDYPMAAYAGGPPPAPTNPTEARPGRLATLGVVCPVTGEPCDLRESNIAWRKIWVCDLCLFQTANREEAHQRSPDKVPAEEPPPPEPPSDPAPEPTPAEPTIE